MRGNEYRASFGFGSNLTPLGKKMLILYGAVYVLELLCEHWLDIPVAAALQLYPYDHPDFRIWQILTHPFIHHPMAPLGFLINCLVFYFFVGPVQNALGADRFLTLFYIAALGGALCGLAFSRVSGFDAPFMGMLPSILAVIVVFGLMNPEATILLMFILPVKAKYISYGTALITLLTFLSKVNPHGAYHLGGLLFGYIYFKGPKYVLDPAWIKWKYLEWRIKRKKSRFQVIDGYKDKKDGPTIH